MAPYPDPLCHTDFRKACRIDTRTSICLLQRSLAEPASYTPPSGWYKNYPAHKPPVFSLNGALLLSDAVRQRMRRWYKRLLARQIARITGYGARTIRCWCTEDRLKAFSHQHTYKVPKEWLLEFLTSEYYNNITRKSKEHYAMIAAVRQSPRGPRRKAEGMTQESLPLQFEFIWNC